MNTKDLHDIHRRYQNAIYEAFAATKSATDTMRAYQAGGWMRLAEEGLLEGNKEAFWTRMGYARKRLLEMGIDLPFPE